MRAKLIAAVLVLVLILALCAFSYCVVKSETDSMRELSKKAVSALDAGEDELVETEMTRLQARLVSGRATLEILTLHNAINRVGERIIQAKAHIELNQQDEFRCDIALLDEDLTVLFEQQKLTWSNLF